MQEGQKFISRDFKEGDTILQQGDTGSHVYIIIHGSVDVYKQADERSELVATLHSGDILGEMAILTNEPRCASAVAREATKVIMVKDRTMRMALLNNELPILKPLTRQLVLRFREAEQQSSLYRTKIDQLEQENGDLRQRLLRYETDGENNLQ
ncbi:MAG: cyclic nucleotide-binding domain-containing protein [Thermodesulfobacteriota bacterium]